ncbi:hypothetical protein J0383_02915 [Flavobacterium endoglycinae]|uniref:DUF3575 domain-containing protein n=1 Tax=Flavobacterium endoglycinae TaxID=2816357 RepID=A0ABX7QGR1_9FLAO|nr:DUF6048 family protein [Flavobacterium endoglycinae]QSW89776.1 hypothetical protein J0383_02915 [Flavobacterium endoglycinae]
MKHILKYTFSLCFLLSMFLVHSQVTKDTITLKDLDDKKPKVTAPKSATTEVKKDSVPVPPKTDRYGLRVGVDLYKLTRAFYDKDYKGIEFTADWRLTKRYYIAAELGFEDKTTDDDRLNSTATGTYIKGGFDYNLYDNWLDMENLITIGLRGGFSSFSQDLNSYKIYNPNPYWGEQPSIAANEKHSGLSAAWLEVAMGIKAKVFNNIFVGFGVQLKLLAMNNKPAGFDNLYIPGFNRTYDGSFGVGFNYTVSYFIPIYKKKVIVPEIKKEEAPKKKK